MRSRNIGWIALAIALWGAPLALAQEERAECARPSRRARDRRAAVFVGALPARVGVPGRPADHDIHDGAQRSRAQTPADAVLEEGDVIVSVDGKLSTTTEASRRLRLLEPGDRVRLRIRRDGGEKDVTITAVPTCDFLRHGVLAIDREAGRDLRGVEAPGRELRDAVRRARRDVERVRLGRPVRELSSTSFQSSTIWIWTSSSTSTRSRPATSPGRAALRAGPRVDVRLLLRLAAGRRRCRRVAGQRTRRRSPASSRAGPRIAPDAGR